jgi:SAM-dependent methyltransferase
MKSVLFPEDIARDYDLIMSYFNYNLSATICDRILRIASISPSSNILEVGIGTGKFASELQRKGYRLQGIDNSPYMLKRCNDNFPEITTECADVSVYRPNKKFQAIISHAGPLRLNHLSGLNLSEEEAAKFEKDFGKLFFETYLSSESCVDSTMANLSILLDEQALLILYIQSFPGREKITRSTPDRLDFDGRQYVKNTRYVNKKLHKTREVFEGKGLIWSALHVMTPIKLDHFCKIAFCKGLESVCVDPSNHFYVLRKKKNAD